MFTKFWRVKNGVAKRAKCRGRGGSNFGAEKESLGEKLREV